MPDPTLATRTPGRRTIVFTTPDAVLADVERLRRGGYRKVGNWTLPQVCNHLAWVMTASLTPPGHDDPPTAEQLAMKAKFFDTVLNGMPEGMPLPADKCPPATCADADIDALTTAFAAVAAYPHARQMVGRCGPVPIDEVRQLHLAHAAHHLSFLEPTTVRRQLNFGSLADVAADIDQLRQGYVRSANWSLPQVCWHLRATMERMLAHPMAEATPEQVANRPTLESVLSGKPLPSGLPCPDALLPPPTATDGDVDAFLSLLRYRTEHPTPAVNHRLFGPITPDQALRLVLAHCANHLSHLIPDPH